MKKQESILLSKLLFKGSGKGKLIVAWFALFAGTALLLIAISVWWNFREMLDGKKGNDAASTYITINKAAGTGEKSFTESETAAIKLAPQVQDAGTLLPASFSVYISAGGSLGFSTLLPLQSVPDRFIDNLPDDWQWKNSDIKVPVIIPHEFLNQYNFVFAPSQGLPQLSEEAIRNIGFSITVAGKQHYVGHIVGFSDRIQSVLVPEAFITYNNNIYGNAGGSNSVSQLILQVKDPSSKEFVQYLDTHHYTTNSEQLRWNKLRSIVEIVSIATGVLALMLILLSIVVFQLFIELAISRVKDAVQLLLHIGYSPRVLTRFLTKRFIPIALSATFAGVKTVSAAQLIFHFAVKKISLHASPLPGYPVWVAALVCFLVLSIRIRSTIKKSLR